MTNWHDPLATWKSEFGCTLLAPADSQALSALRESLGPLPEELAQFYSASNGLTCGWFQMYPIYIPSRPKTTWDGVERANDPAKTRFLAWKPELLASFLIFASVDANNCAAYERSTGKIWFEEACQLVETHFELDTFIEACFCQTRDF